MVEIEAKSGLVGFFDILGYSQMLLANDVASTAKIVVNVGLLRKSQEFTQ